MLLEARDRSVFALSSAWQTTEHPDLEDGLRVQMFTDAAARSARSGSWVELAESTT